jgi:hypothetical protein
VFHHHHDAEPISERIDHLMDAVFIPDDRERLEKIAEELAPDFVYVGPRAVVDGTEGLSEAFSRYRHEDWRHTSLRRTSAVDIHHGHFRYAWERRESGAIAMEGWSFGWVDAEGRIARIVSFDGLVPGQPPPA